MNQFHTPKMNLNFVRTFVILGQSKSINEAIEKLNMDRTNISRNITALEKEFGTKLFNTDIKDFGLTEDGKKVFEGYEQAYNILFITEKNFRQSKNLNSGKLTLGISNDVENDIISEKINNFKQQYPNVVIKIVNLPTNDLYNKLAQFSMDFIIDSSVENLPKIKNIKCSNLYTEEYCISYSKSHYNLNITSIKDLDNLPLILSNKSKREREEIDSIFKNEHLVEKISMEIDNYHSALKYIQSGLGIGILPKRLVVNNNDLINVDIDLKKDIVVAYIEENLCPSAKMLLENYILEK